ncbi:hypothetical protein LGQ02_17475 [Bacillus shivajii]|uniref:hypothetical protein n=1 Tax=Bacillus shivajii TaxID=1983719 RepID=UPI001CF980AE|nr:hypothetical protein [Bacillus shivajii]UCZ52583.1 hypothetical protein LGQ02_17475 [Bacillus shivajii]
MTQQIKNDDNQERPYTAPQTSMVRLLSRTTVFALFLVPVWLIITDSGMNESNQVSSSDEQYEENSFTLKWAEEEVMINKEDALSIFNDHHVVEQVKIIETTLTLNENKATTQLSVVVNSTIDEKEARKMIEAFLNHVSKNLTRPKVDQDNQYFGTVWDHNHVYVEFIHTVEGEVLFGEVKKGTHKINIYKK